MRNRSRSIQESAIIRLIPCNERCCCPHLLALLVDFAASVCDLKLDRTIDFPRRASDRVFRVLSRWSPIKFKTFSTGLMLLADEFLSIEAAGLLDAFCCVPYAFSKELRTEALDSALSIAARTMEDEELLIATCPLSY